MPEPDFLKSILIADAMLIIERSGRVSWCNEQAARIAGIEAGANPGARFFREYGLYRGDGITSLSLGDLPVASALAGHRISDFEICLRSKRTRGESRWYSIMAEPLFVHSSEGAPDHVDAVMITCHDISERRGITDALRKSEELYRFLSEGMSQFVWTVDENGVLDYCNRHWFQYSGLTFESTAARGWLDIIHPDDRAGVIERVRDSRRTGRPFEMEYRLRRASDGSYRWHLGRARLLEDSSGKRKWLGTAIDIDDLRRTHKALRDSEERFRRLMDSGIIGIAFWDEHRVITEANDAWLRTTGRTRDDITCERALRWDDVLSGDSAPAAEAAFRQISERGMCDTFECRHLAPDGSRVTVLAGGVALPEGGGLAFALDISEQRRLEDKLRQAAKLESLGILAGGIAHDFNNLLTGVLANATLAIEEAPFGSVQADLLRAVVRAAEKAAELTHQMLAYSGRGRFRLEYVDLSALVTEILTLIETAVGRKVTLRLQIAENIPAIEADPAQLQQIIMNLVINAAESITGSGEVTVVTGLAELSGREEYLTGATPAGPHVFLEVRDTGRGMDSETIERIFDPFFTTKFTGRGLGLASVLGIVRGHEGAMRVNSTPGVGTVFTVFLPASTHPATYPERNASVSSRRGAGLILVVDDEEFVRETVRRTLETVGYTVVCAATGGEAIPIFQTLAGQVEAAIIDMTMPGVEGDEVARRLKHMHSELRIIATSGYPEKDVRQRFGDSMDAFLPKPYRSEQLRDAIAALLG